MNTRTGVTLHADAGEETAAGRADPTGNTPADQPQPKLKKRKARSQAVQGQAAQAVQGQAPHAVQQLPAASTQGVGWDEEPQPISATEAPGNGTDQLRSAK